MKPLRLLSFLIKAAMVLFAIATLLAVVTLPSTLSGGGVGVDANLAAPYAVTKAEGPSFRVDGDADVHSARAQIHRATTRVNVSVGKHDRDARLVIEASLAVAIALGWIALLALRGIVASAESGDPFAMRNVTRLRWLAGVLVAFPLLGAVGNRMLEAAFDTTTVHPYLARVDALPLLAIALAIFALSEVFRHGAELRDLEASTI